MTNFPVNESGGCTLGDMAALALICKPFGWAA